jgi:hypothetical protein
MRKAKEKEEVARRAVAVLSACLAVVCFGGGSTAMAEGTSTEIECVGDACQPLPPEPEDPTPGTLGNGPTNPPPPKASAAGKNKPKKHRRHRNRHRNA